MRKYWSCDRLQSSWGAYIGVENNTALVALDTALVVLDTALVALDNSLVPLGTALVVDRYYISVVLQAASNVFTRQYTKARCTHFLIFSIDFKAILGLLLIHIDFKAILGLLF